MAGVPKNASVMPRELVSPPPGDWRMNYQEVNERQHYLLDSGLYADVTFHVGSDNGEIERIRAHKMILAMHSRVFDAMFANRVAENRDSVDNIIRIPDFHPHAFNTMLRFMYSGRLSWCDTCDIVEAWHAAKKYEIKELEMYCIKLLKFRLSEKTVVSTLQAAQLFGEEELKEKAYGFLKRNFTLVMQYVDFFNISKENLRLVLQGDDTFASELSIFHAVLWWAETQCLKTGISVSPDNTRLVLGDLLQLVRFLGITSEEIVLNVIPSSILTPEEGNLLMQHKAVEPKNRGSLPYLPFSDRRRSFSTFKAEFRSEIRGKYVGYAEGNSCFTVDHPVSIVGFGFYGPYDADNASYKVTIKLE